MSHALFWLQSRKVHIKSLTVAVMLLPQNCVGRGARRASLSGQTAEVVCSCAANWYMQALCLHSERCLLFADDDDINRFPAHDELDMCLLIVCTYCNSPQPSRCWACSWKQACCHAMHDFGWSPCERGDQQPQHYQQGLLKLQPCPRGWKLAIAFGADSSLAGPAASQRGCHLAHCECVPSCSTWQWTAFQPGIPLLLGAVAHEPWRGS